MSIHPKPLLIGLKSGMMSFRVAANMKRNEDINKIIKRQRAFLEHHLRMQWWKTDRDKEKAMFAMLDMIKNKLIINNIWY